MSNSTSKPEIESDEPSTRSTCMIFVDGTNIDQRCKRVFHRSNIDYDKLFKALAGDRELSEVVYCTAPYVRASRNDKVYAEQQGRLNRIKKLPYTVIREGRHAQEDIECERQKGGCGRKFKKAREKKTDVAVASALVRAACMHLADTVILVGGDNDFAPALKIAKETGIKVEVAFVVGPSESPAGITRSFGEMLEHADRRVRLDEHFMDSCWFRKNR